MVPTYITFWEIVDHPFVEGAAAGSRRRVV
jgi:hypothetical protein